MRRLKAALLTFNGDREKWEQLRDELHEAEIEAVGQAVWETNDPDRLWREDENFRKAMRPILADVGETAQFLAMKGLVLNSEATALFLNFFYDDLAAALKRLMPQADGDYSPDEYRKRFPKFEGSDTGETPSQLFERWVAEHARIAGISWSPQHSAHGEIHGAIGGAL